MRQHLHVKKIFFPYNLEELFIYIKYLAQFFKDCEYFEKYTANSIIVDYTIAKKSSINLLTS